MLNDFQKPDEIAKSTKFTCGSVVVQHQRFWLDDDEGRYIWLREIPECVCGEPLVRDSERPPKDRLVPVDFTRRHGTRVVCEACGEGYEVQP